MPRSKQFEAAAERAFEALEKSVQSLIDSWDVQETRRKMKQQFVEALAEAISAATAEEDY